MNKVTCVCKTLVYKRYDLPQKWNAEVVAIKTLSQIIPESIPTIVKSNSNLCILEYIEGLSGFDIKNNKNLNKQIAELIIKIFNLYKDKKILRITTKPWNKSIQYLIKDFKENQLLLNKIVGKSLTTKLLKNLKIISKTPIKQDKLTLVHRDLHLGNIILNKNNCVLIDFEHTMEAPLELEFQNSLFWNDEMSLDVDVIKLLLRISGLEYSNELEKLLLNYYVSEQLLLALKEKDKRKMQKIVSIYLKTK